MDSKSKIKNQQTCCKIASKLPSKTTEMKEKSDKPMKIVHLNDRCLTNVFVHSNLSDLLNIAMSNKRFQHIAGVAFKQKYSDKQVEIYSNVYGDICLRIDKEEIDKDKIESFLLIFGDCISSIKLRHSEGGFSEQIFHAVQSHSLKSLIRIEFHLFPKGWLNKLTKPMPTIEAVFFYKCNLGSKHLLLDTIFPSLCRMEINCEDNNIEHNQIKACFPNMKTMILDLSCRYNLTDFETILSLNPQLTTLVMSQRCRNWKLIRLIAEKLQLEEFELFVYNNLIPPEEKECFRFKELKQFHYLSWGKAFPFAFDQLEQLSFDCGEAKERLRTCEIDEMIKGNKKLVEVTLTANSIQSLNSIKTSRKLRRIPNITVIIDRLISVFEINAVIEFINERSSALKIKFEIVEKQDKYVENYIVELKKKIDKSKWKIKYNDDVIILERKI